MPEVLQLLVRVFRSALAVDWTPPPDLLEAARQSVEGCNGECHEPDTLRRRLFVTINQKFRLNREPFQNFLDAAASKGHLFNYHQKVELLNCFDRSDHANFLSSLRRHAPRYQADGMFNPLTESETLTEFQKRLKAPTVARKDARSCDPSVRRDEILRALFGSFVFHAFPTEVMHAFHNPDCRVEHHPDFYRHLLRFHPEALHRKCALVFLVVDGNLPGAAPFNDLRDAVCARLRDSYDRLSNHCYFAILIKPFPGGEESYQWRLFSDLVLYAEKHRETNLKAGYFLPGSVARDTTSHIPGLNVREAQFHVANEGYFYRDCFVISGLKESVHTTSAPVDLLLTFEKNERDETLIPCPGCRSRNVAGNSYPVLGVRSWECQNPICPERSAFDRGNRYSLAQLIKQEAIKSDVDQIPAISLRAWKLDVVPQRDISDVVDMLVRHYTLHGDQVSFINTPAVGASRHGRLVSYEDMKVTAGCALYQQFEASPFFKRFLSPKVGKSGEIAHRLQTGSEDVELIHGDCFEVLTQLPEQTIDAAVTSPPYYNARSYFTWTNMYCYLHDMYHSAVQIHRVLKPGGVYLYNIFDYFDNEKTIALSAMGKKRMILGAYIINLFRNIGFRLRGNTVWYKGEVEGKRNFNQGNRSPYYQFPFNCWEHILIFQKSGPEMTMTFPSILAEKPVIKMIGGKNILGHSAPFPPAIPELVIKQMKPGQTVLDPYAGSMTTARTALKHGIKSVSVELSRDYCKLGLKLIRQMVEAPLFALVNQEA